MKIKTLISSEELQKRIKEIGKQITEEYKNKEYDPLTLPQSIERCKELIYMFNKKKIKAITVGNIDENNLNEGKKDEIKVIAGPRHKEFPQLVEDSIWYDSIVGKIKKYNSKVKEVKVEVHPSNVNNVIGYEKENLDKFKELYGIMSEKKLKIQQEIGKLNKEIKKNNKEAKVKNSEYKKMEKLANKFLKIENPNNENLKKLVKKVVFYKNKKITVELTFLQI